MLYHRVRPSSPCLLGLPEVEFLAERAAAICAEHPDDANGRSRGRRPRTIHTPNAGTRQQLPRFAREHHNCPAVWSVPCSGRMVTSDPAANIDAAVHVAHAFTVHAEESESDYFSVVDDLQSNDEDPGAAHIGDMELTAGLFYGYVVVDVPTLISNLTGCLAEDWRNADRELAATVVKHLVHLIATVSPGAKLGSTAPYAYADLMLIEAGSRQPRSLANAFRGPVPAQTKKAVEALAGQLGKLDAAYGSRETRRVMSLDACNIPAAERLDLDRLASWAADAVSSERGKLSRETSDSESRGPADGLRRRDDRQPRSYTLVPVGVHAYRIAGQRLGLAPNRRRSTSATAGQARIRRPNRSGAAR